MLNKLIIAGTVLAALSTSSFAAGYSQSGAEKLKRVLKPHYYRIPITKDVRAATGDKNIAVFDYRRGFNSTVYTCSYVTYRGKRALQCY